MKHLMQCEGLLDRRFVADIEKVMLVMINMAQERAWKNRTETQGSDFRGSICDT